MALVLPVVVLARIPMLFLLSPLLGDGLVETAPGWTLALVAGTLVGTALMTALNHAFSPTSLGLRQSLTGAGVTAALTACTPSRSSSTSSSATPRTVEPRSGPRGPCCRDARRGGTQRGLYYLGRPRAVTVPAQTEVIDAYGDDVTAAMTPTRCSR
jgi:hypothetical protein